tara:strand:- start:175 stop:282 length:108 start_codon:yes stop_codon:yes gene_type:complete
VLAYLKFQVFWRVKRMHYEENALATKNATEDEDGT